MAKAKTTLLIGCGALAREILAVIKLNRLDHMHLTCLPAIWHNTPDKIVPGIIRKIDENRDRFDRILVLYGDCGTGGELDKALAERAVERIAGPHCYSFFAGEQAFDTLMEEEIGSFFLTDYLAQNFEHLILDGMGISTHPGLKNMLFSHYKRLIYLAQSPTEALIEKAKAAAAELELDYEFRLTGYGGLTPYLTRSITRS